MKATVTIGTTYCGCPSETIEIEYWDENDFAEAVLEAIFNSEAPHYFIDVEDEEDEEDYNEDLEDEEEE